MSLNASSAAIADSFATLVDSSYGGLEASVELINATHVIWRLELLTTWQACTNQLALPLLGVTCFAKVSATVERRSTASCLSGGVGLSLSGSDATAHLPWDATEAEAEATVASLLGDGTDVMVHRSGDGHASNPNPNPGPNPGPNPNPNPIPNPDPNPTLTLTR